MLFEDVETQRLNAIIKDGARQWTLAEMAVIDSAIRQHKPPTYDAHIQGVRKRYKGDQDAIVTAALKKRFPKTYEQMPTDALPYLRYIAASDAGVYRMPPERSIVDDAGKPIDDESRKQLFAKLLEGANLDGLAPEIERRTIAARTLFVLPRWFRAPGQTKGGRLVLEMFWPEDVGVICHASDPANMDLCLVLKARIASRGGVTSDAAWYSLWVRDHEEDEAGNLTSLGPWRVHLVNSKGEYLVAPNDPSTLYVDGAGRPLPLPWVRFTVGVAEGSVYVDEDRDLVGVVDGLNVSRASRKYTTDMQGFTPIVYAGNEKKAGEVVVGPGEITQVGGTETLTTLALDPKLQDMREDHRMDLAEIGHVRRNPAGYALRGEGQQVASGVARKIENEPHDAVLDENAHQFRLVEQNELLPAMVRVHDAFSGNPPIGPCSFRVITRRPPEPQDPEAKQRQVDADVAAGRISPARGAVELGLYPNEDAAVQVMGEGARQVQQRPASNVGNTFANLFETPPDNGGAP